jgi:hypothetical protein
MVFISIALIGCGGGGNAPPTIVTQILSDPAVDGDILVPLAGPIIVTQGMTPSIQSVFAGIDPATGAEYRAFLDFPLTGVPVNAVIVSATLDIVIDNIFLQPPFSTIPILIDLVSFQRPLAASDFDRNSLLPLVSTTIVPPISSLDVGQHVFVDVTSLMAEAQFRGLSDFQIRILLDFNAVSGLIEINDTTGADRVFLAPLLQVEYF